MIVVPAVMTSNGLPFVLRARLVHGPVRTSEAWTVTVRSVARALRARTSLNRPRKELHVVDKVVLSVMVDRLAGPSGLENLERFVEHLAARAIIELLARL